MEDTRCRWQRAYIEALDYDTWGQVEEAVEGYQRLQVASSAEFVENVLQLPMNRRECIGKLAAALKCRIQELQTGKDNGIGLQGVKAIKPFLAQLIVSDARFPNLGPKAERLMGMPLAAAAAPEAAGRPYAPAGGASMGGDRPPVAGPSDGARQPVAHGPGCSLLAIKVVKWSFKDTTIFKKPQLVMSVRDREGRALEPAQEVPAAKAGTHQAFFFEPTLRMETPINKLPQGAAVFFEFRHWKDRPKKFSCKAYCFLEADEIKPGPVTLEVYIKPADYRRIKRPELLTNKPLFLHLELDIQRT